MTIRRFDIGSLAEAGETVFRSPEAAALHAMWSDLRGDRAAPFRAELDAGKIGAKAPYLAIFEQVGPSNLRIRIAGDRLNRWFGLELRGMSALSMALPPCRNHLQATLNRVTAEPAVAVAHGAARGDDRGAPGFEAVLLPMRSDFGPVDRVLLGLWLDPAEAPPAGPMRLDLHEIAVSPIGAPVEAAQPAPAAPDGEEAGAPRTPRRGHLRLVKSDAAPPQRRK